MKLLITFTSMPFDWLLINIMGDKLHLLDMGFFRFYSLYWYCRKNGHSNIVILHVKYYYELMLKFSAKIKK